MAFWKRNRDDNQDRPQNGAVEARDRERESAVAGDRENVATHDHSNGELTESGNGAVDWRYLPQSNEVLWFSERNDWGNLYLYGLDGKLKHAVTTGSGNVTEVLRVDAATRTVTTRRYGQPAGNDWRAG